jgi:hypothetical protein
MGPLKTLEWMFVQLGKNLILSLFPEPLHQRKITKFWLILIKVIRRSRRRGGELVFISIYYLPVTVLSTPYQFMLWENSKHLFLGSNPRITESKFLEAGPRNLFLIVHLTFLILTDFRNKWLHSTKKRKFIRHQVHLPTWSTSLQNVLFHGALSICQYAILGKANDCSFSQSIKWANTLLNWRN